MKKITAALCFMTVVGLSQYSFATKQLMNGYLYRSGGLATNATPTFDMGPIDRFSVEAIYSSGTYANVSFTDGTKSSATITVTSTTYVLASTPTLIINGITLTYVPVATATGTAKAISDAIVANVSLNTIIISSWGTNGVVYATSTVPGVNAYTITSSSWAALTPNGVVFAGGIASDVSSTADTITKANTFTTGLGIYITTTTNVALGGLTWGTTYFVISIDATSFKLATTAANATLGTAIDISTSSTGGGAFVLQASTFTAGSAGFAWQVSNDNTNFYTLPIISSVTVPTGTIATQGWDFGTFNYRYLRLNFTGPTRGGVVLDLSIQGKKDE